MSAEATLGVRSKNSSTLDSPNKNGDPLEDSSKSSDPLILDSKIVNNQVQESNRIEKHSRKPSNDQLTKVMGDQKICDEKNLATAANPSQKMSRTYSQTYDGVFSNLCAKPEVMVLPPGHPEERDSPPPYNDQRPHHTAYPGGFANISDVNLSDCIDEIYLDDIEVGSVLSFIVMCFFVVLFQVYGIIIGAILAQSHATRFGVFGGIGLLLAFGSPSIEAVLAQSVGPAMKPYMPIVGIVLGMTGYLLLIYSVVSFQKIRKTAELMISPPRAGGPHQAHYEVAV